MSRSGAVSMASHLRFTGRGFESCVALVKFVTCVPLSPSSIICQGAVMLFGWINRLRVRLIKHLYSAVKWRITLLTPTKGLRYGPC